MKHWLAVVLILMFALPGFAQTKAPAPVKITAVVGEYTAAAYSGFQKTDREGNVYVHLLDRIGPSSSSRGILKISRDGTHVTQFDIRNVSDAGNFLDFTPSPWGDLYVLWTSRSSFGNVLSRFSPGGQLLYSNKVDARVFAANIAALAGGNLLLAVLKGSNRQNLELAADIVSDTGTWISSVPLKTATRIGAGAEDAQGAHHSPTPAGRGIEVLASGDGEAYITQNDPYPVVFRILSSGQVTRYDLPRPGGQVRLNGTLVANGQMLVSYQLLENTGKPNNFILKGRVCELIDLGSGTTQKLFPATSNDLHVIAFGPDSLLSFRSARTADGSKLRFEFRETRIE